MAMAAATAMAMASAIAMAMAAAGLLAPSQRYTTIEEEEACRL